MYVYPVYAAALVEVCLLVSKDHPAVSIPRLKQNQIYEKSRVIG